MSRHLVAQFLLSFALMNASAIAATTYEVGGPLEGVPIPLYPTQHGEAAGFPGCLPGSTNFLAEGQCPEPFLYDGSVEHWRTYFQKYLPIKSSFDRQSLLHNWLAKDLPGIAKEQIESYAEPVFWTPRFGNAVDTGKRNKPVPVVRCKAGSPAIRIDLGTLPQGLYAIRVIGAVEASSLQRHRKPLVLRLTVNDGLNGETSAYPLRCGYVEEFYSVAEFYFHAPTKRAYQATLTVDEGSQVELLVHNIDLHDVMAGMTQRAIKTRPTLGLKTAAAKPAANTDARLARDAMLWSQFPPINAQQGYLLGGGGDDPLGNRPNFGAGGLSQSEIEDKHGKWETDPSATPAAFLINKKLNLRYTMDDLRAHRPLPDPYPFKDNGTGVFTPSANPGENPQNWIPVAEGVTRRVRE